MGNDYDDNDNISSNNFNEPAILLPDEQAKMKETYQQPKDHDGSDKGKDDDGVSTERSQRSPRAIIPSENDHGGGRGRGGGGAGGGSTAAAAAATTPTTTKQRQQQLPPTANSNNNHKRVISWGPDVLLAAAEQQGSIGGSTSSTNNRARPANTGGSSSSPLALDDVLGVGGGGTTSRYETEAETHILRALERQPSNRQQSSSIHGSSSSNNIAYSSANIPDYMDEDLSIGQQQQQQQQQQHDGQQTTMMHRPLLLRQKTAARFILNSSSNHHGHRRMLSTEDQLANLTSTMNLFRHDEYNDSDNNNNNDDDGDVAAAAATAADTDDQDDDTRRQENNPGHYRKSHNSHDHLGSIAERRQGGEKESTPSVSSPPPPSSHSAGVQLFENARALLSTDEDDSSNSSGSSTVSPTSSNDTDNNNNGNRQGGGGRDIEAGISEGGEAPTSKKKKWKKNRRIKKKKKRTGRSSATTTTASDKFREDWEIWKTFFRPRRAYISYYLKTAVLYIALPATALSALLFYAFENPPTGKTAYGYSDLPSDDAIASASWWILFLAVRQLVTFSLAILTQLLVIDFLCLGTRILVRILGPVLTLLLAQSKGWPFITLMWCSYNFALLHGNHPFAHHWGYWQEPVGLFNSQNPSGHVVDSEPYFKVLIIGISVSCVVVVKRFVLGLWLGRNTYSQFGEQLAQLMNKMLLVTEVSQASKEIERAMTAARTSLGGDNDATEQMLPFGIPNIDSGLNRSILDAVEEGDDSDTIVDGTGSVTTASAPRPADDVINMENRDPLTGSLHHLEKMKLKQLLERWEEPERFSDQFGNKNATISAVLQFRSALTSLRKGFPFSFAFGPADTREECIDSAQRVYARLMMCMADDTTALQFERIIALISCDEKGIVDQEKAKDFIRLFRPDRQGRLTMLDFVRSVDSVFKELKLLQASIDNSSQIDHAFENILNVLFYTVVVIAILAVLGLDPLAIFLSLSSVILGFAFMISSASSKYFEGMLFILVRRPYNIGDLMHTSNVEATNLSFDGSVGWVVKHVTLFETVCTWLPTQEQCSLSNGSLANSRIINWNRSTQAQFHIFMNFPIATPYDKILLFKAAVEEYLKMRPREWLSLNGFRCNRFYHEKAYVEYILVVQHRDRWSNVAQVLDSKANLTSYCMEVAKQLKMDYKAPPLPVNLRYGSAAGPSTEMLGNNVTADSSHDFGGNACSSSSSSSSSDTVDNDNVEDHFRTFRSMARNQHNIRVA